MEKYIISLIDGVRYCKANGQFARHLKKHNLSHLEYYETYVTGIKELCPYCFKAKQFYTKDFSYASTCGHPTCVGKEVSKTKTNWSEEQRASDSNNKKAASKNVNLAIKKQKFKDTSLKKYGVEHPWEAKAVREKTKKTKLDRYGNEYYSGWEKSKEKNRLKSEHEQHLINEKRRATNLSLYGVENTFLLSSTTAQNKGNSLIKEYMLPSGKIIGLRGYEPVVLDILIYNFGYTEECLIIDDCFSRVSNRNF